MTARLIALIPAGGVGTRVGGAVPKQYAPVASRPMLAHVLAAFAATPAVERIAVVVAADDPHVDDVVATIPRPVDVVRDGGPTRDASVANGLAALAGRVADDDWILVHDAARCGVTPPLIARLVEAIGDDAVGGLFAIPLDDTTKRALDRDGPPAVAATVDRRGLWRAQTPQMFRYRLLVDALAAAHARGATVTDESSAIEAAGHRARLVAGSPANFKVTTPEDLAMMDVLLRARASGAWS